MAKIKVSYCQHIIKKLINLKCILSILACSYALKGNLVIVPSPFADFTEHILCVLDTLILCYLYTFKSKV